MDAKNLTIGVLTVTAAILFVGLVVVNTIDVPAAYGFAQSMQGGDYLVVTGQQRSERELIYVIDAGGRAERLGAYVFDRDRGELHLVGEPFDLNRLRGGRERPR